MKTQLEKNIRSSRRQDGLIVPLLNELFKGSLEIETEADAQFLYALALKQVEREKVRKSGDGVYSPSGLASCLRRVYLGKNWKEMGLERVSLPAIEAHYYFLTGDFIHLKWQYAFYKLSMVLDDFWLIDCEVPVASKRGDHGGTIDVVALYRDELLPFDVKGLNARTFHQIDGGDMVHDYRIQLTDYMMLWNAGVKSGLLKPTESMKELVGEKFPLMKRGFVLAENKGGPDPNHPTALTEYEIKLKDNLPEVRLRLEALRAHQEEKTVPEIECTSTRTVQYGGCPFAEFCKKEVRIAERRTDAARRARPLKLAKPKRANRARRPRSK